VVLLWHGVRIVAIKKKPQARPLGAYRFLCQLMLLSLGFRSGRLGVGGGGAVRIQPQLVSRYRRDPTSNGQVTNRIFCALSHQQT
jgi:hypothetical protein